jgi:flavin reductase (DIM6/NTAB) family NADH-FMN oxidoreductase RutF
MSEIKKQVWRPGTMLNPVPAVLVSCKGPDGSTNIMTAAWAGVLCSDPAYVYVSIRPSRHSYQMIKDTGEYVINLTTEDLAAAADYCGVKSGKDTDKWKAMSLTEGKAAKVNAPLINESPVNIECRVKQILPLGTHDVFIGEVLAVDADERYMDEKGKFDLDKCRLIAYSHGEYRKLGDVIGTFGYTVRKKR